MISQVRYPRNLQEADETPGKSPFGPKQGGEVVWDCMFLRGTAKITDWWRNLRLLGEKAWTLFLPCSLPPSTSTLRHQEIGDGVLAGGRTEGYRILSPGCQNVCHKGEMSGTSAQMTALGCQTRKGGALPVWRQGPSPDSVLWRGAEMVLAQRGQVLGQVSQLSKARLLFSHFRPAGAPRLGSGPLQLPTLLEFCSCFPRASILHVLAAPRAATRPPPLQVCLLSSALSTVSPGMMSLASSGAKLPLRPCRLLSRPLPRSLEEASAAGASNLLLSPPAARPLLRRLLASACPLSLPSPSVSLPTLPSIRPFSLSLRPVRYGSSLPGSARLWVAPSKGGSIQPEGFTALHSQDPQA